MRNKFNKVDKNLKDTLLITALSISKDAKNSRDLIGCCEYRSGGAWPIQFNWGKLIESYKFFNCSDLTIYNIHNTPNILNPSINIIDEVYRIKVIDIYIDNFFEEDFIQKHIYNKPIDINNKIFIFREIDWKILRSKFKDIDYNLSGGSLTHRYLLTPNHMKLTHFILCLEGYQPALTGVTFSYLYHKKRHKLLNIEKFENNNYIKLIFDAVKALHKYSDSEILSVLYNLYYNDPKLIQVIFESVKSILLDFKDSDNKKERYSKLAYYLEEMMNNNNQYMNDKNKIINLKNFSEDSLSHLIDQNVIWKERSNQNNKYSLKDIPDLKEYSGK